MAKRAQQKRAQLTRQKIVEAGALLFATEGFHQTSSKKIAKEAGCAVGTFYNHFADKKELMLAVYADHAQKVHQMVFESLKQGGFGESVTDGKTVVQEIVSQALKLHTLSPEFHREVNVLRYSDPQMAQLVAKQNQKMVQTMVELLQPHRKNLRVADLEAACLVVIAAVEEVVHSIKMFTAPIEEQRLLSALGEMIYRYLFR